MGRRTACGRPAGTRPASLRDRIDSQIAGTLLKNIQRGVRRGPREENERRGEGNKPDLTGFKRQADKANRLGFSTGLEGKASGETCQVFFLPGFGKTVFDNDCQCLYNEINIFTPLCAKVGFACRAPGNRD